MSVFHCMKIVLLQKCIEHDIPEVVGLNNQPVSWVVQKLEIARDFLREVQIAPFICFKIQGEPAVSNKMLNQFSLVYSANKLLPFGQVERVRCVGSILLSIVNNAPTVELERRAQTQFTQLLDVLVRLDSKASDSLEVLELAPDFC